MTKYIVLNDSGISPEIAPGKVGDKIIAKGEVVELDENSEQTKHFLEGQFIAPYEEEIALVDHVVSQADLDANPELVKESIKVGDTIQLPPISEETLTDEQKAEIEKEHPGSFPEFAVAVPVEEVEPAEVHSYYRGKLITSQSENEVEGHKHISIMLEDGVRMDLTPTEYAAEVITK